MARIDLIRNYYHVFLWRHATLPCPFKLAPWTTRDNPPTRTTVSRVTDDYCCDADGQMMDSELICDSLERSKTGLELVNEHFNASSLHGFEWGFVWCLIIGMLSSIKYDESTWKQTRRDSAVDSFYEVQKMNDSSCSNNNKKAEQGKKQLPIPRRPVSFTSKGGRMMEMCSGDIVN